MTEGYAVSLDGPGMELNGVYCMLCSGLRAWHDMQGNLLEATAAATLKDVYSYELHRAGGGCSWRDAGWDWMRVLNGLKACRLDHVDPRDAQRALASLLDANPIPWLGLTRIPHEPSRADRTGTAGERFGVVEQYHNALRRIIAPSEWDQRLDRTFMDRNLRELTEEAAHVIRVERDGGRPDLSGLLELSDPTR